MNLRFTTKILVIAIVVGLVFVWSPLLNVSGLDAVFNAVTFIYGVLFGFEISIVLSNFISLKTALTQLNAVIRSIYVSLKAVNPQVAEFAANKMERYLMKSVDTDLVAHHKTDKEFKELIEIGSEKELQDVTKADSDGQGVRVQFVYQGLYDLSNARKQVEQVAPKFIEAPEWIMLIALASIMIMIMFLQRTSNITSITSAILATTIIGSLIILHDIDSNDLQEGLLEYEMFNATLTEIGKERYYPDFAIKNGAVKIPEGTKYRKGVFPNYPDLKERKIELVTE